MSAAKKRSAPKRCEVETVAVDAFIAWVDAVTAATDKLRSVPDEAEGSALTQAVSTFTDFLMHAIAKQLKDAESGDGATDLFRRLFRFRGALEEIAQKTEDPEAIMWFLADTADGMMAARSRAAKLRAVKEALTP